MLLYAFVTSCPHKNSTVYYMNPDYFLGVQYSVWRLVEMLFQDCTKSTLDKAHYTICAVIRLAMSCEGTKSSSCFVENMASIRNVHLLSENETDDV
jgi:hypothetical protein